MDAAHIAALLRELGARPSRRAVATALVTLGASTTLASLVERKGIAAKGKGKHKKKKGKKKNNNNDDDLPPLPRPVCPSDLATPGPCGCCPAPLECCPSGGAGGPSCYNPATEACCPAVRGDCANVCPQGTTCEVWDNPSDVLIPATFCCPYGTNTCGLGCCPQGSVCCSFEGDPGYAWMCCPDSSCDEVNTDCNPSGHYTVDPRFCD
jgi:hypothetical protein